MKSNEQGIVWQKKIFPYSKEYQFSCPIANMAPAFVRAEKVDVFIQFGRKKILHLVNLGQS